ncbi:Glycosyltransferase involved in cell wall bisynthesis [Rhodovulum sp. ES.010]|uniref:glycosyltransferase family 4 protein n=1 Tax=Rhodovulum sp. ES.010 TaxID=1882821 RepID=UPI00092AC150|nr:glycosyltransferase family 4 protein [Rhodovulum sp. ES.010]SIO54531.1 Glycosyltransferase involved in cell wall bisynthesis [Rhodovulum sp. ES.010]
MSRRAVFAIPGDIDTVTGGYVYEKQVLLGLRRAGWEVVHLPLPGSFPDPTPEDMRVTGDAFAALDPDVPVILDGFLPGATDPGQLARLRPPFVAVTHHPLALETGLPPARAGHLYRVERANLARAAHVLVPSPETARTLVAEYGVAAGRITVAPPGVTRPPTDAPGRATAPPLIVSVGLLVPRKGHDVLLRALAEIADLPWRAVIVGDAPDPACAADLETLRARLGLARRVQFAGLVAEDDLARYFAQASVFALATRYEGYGMVFAEALAHGLPIVAARGGAVAETVPAGAGLLVPPDDVAGFAAALRRVLGDPAARAALAAASARHGAALPGWDDTAGIAAGVLERIAPA